MLVVAGKKSKSQLNKTFTGDLYIVMRRRVSSYQVGVSVSGSP